MFGDNDVNQVGQTAADELAKRMANRMLVDVKIPPEPDTDWLDVLRARAA